MPLNEITSAAGGWRVLSEFLFQHFATAEFLGWAAL
jgi:hypothetical protein